MAGDVKNFPGGKPIVILGTNGTDLYGITVDTSGHLQIDVLSNALPTGAATETTLASVLAKLDVALSTRALEAGGNLQAIKTALQLIDDFALGTNKLFGYNAVYALRHINTNVPAGDFTYDFPVVAAGNIVEIQSIGANNVNRACTVSFWVRNGGYDYPLFRGIMSAANTMAYWTGKAIVPPAANLRIIVYACVLHDVLDLAGFGWNMRIS